MNFIYTVFYKVKNGVRTKRFSGRVVEAEEFARARGDRFLHIQVFPSGRKYKRLRYA